MVWQLCRAEWFVSVEHSTGWGHAGGPTRAWAPADHRDQAGLGGLCLGQAVGCQASCPPLPRCRLRCRLCPQRWSCWCPGCFHAELSSVCAKMALGLSGSLARTHPPPNNESALASHQLSVNAVPEIPRCQLGPRLALGASSGAPYPSLPTLPRDLPTCAAPTPVNSSCSPPCRL